MPQGFPPLSLERVVRLAVGAAHSCVLVSVIDLVYSCVVDSVYSRVIDSVYSRVIDSVYSRVIDSVYSRVIYSVCSRVIDREGGVGLGEVVDS